MCDRVVDVTGWRRAGWLGLCLIAFACGGEEDDTPHVPPSGPRDEMDAPRSSRDSGGESAGSSGQRDGGADAGGQSGSASPSDAGPLDAGSDVAGHGGMGASSDAGSSTTGCTGATPTAALQEPVELATDLHTGVGMGAIAVHGDEVFFITDEQDIMRTSTTGADAEAVVTRPLPSRGLTIDGEYLYWLAGDYDTGQLERMPIAGGEVESFGRARTYYTTEQVIAFDDDYVYWTDFDLDDAMVGGRIMRMPKAGGSAEPFVEGRPGIPFSIATDGKDLFWSEGSALMAPAPASIMAIPLEGGEVRQVGDTVAGAGDLAVDETNVYFGSSEDSPSAGVFRMDKTGGTAIPIASSGFVPPLHLAIDETHVYWGSSGMMKATKDGCEVTTLLEIVGGACEGITTDADYVYYTNGHLGGDTGLVLRLSK